MPVYTRNSAQLEPPPEEPRTPLDWMEECRHREACERVWQEHVDAREHFGWMDDMARGLRCHECEVWDG